MGCLKVLNFNLKFLLILGEIVERLQKGWKLKKAYLTRVAEVEEENEIVRNRLAVKRYLKQLGDIPMKD